MEGVTTVYDGLRHFFNDWFFLQNDDELFLKLSYAGKNGEFACYAQAVEQPAQVLFYSVYPTPVPEERRLAMAELLTRINYGLAHGAFELDFSDGEVRFRTGLFLGETAVTDDLIRPLVYLNLHTMDRHLPAIRAVGEGSATPAEALELAPEPEAPR